VSRRSPQHPLVPHLAPIIDRGIESHRAETGLHYNRWRYYSPGLGRYVRPDPIGQQGAFNLYTYTSNNPIGETDLLGLRPLTRAERDFVPSYFGGVFDVSGIDLDSTLFGKRAHAVVLGKIRLPSDYFIGGNPCNDVDLSNATFASVFAHEVLHEWQCQQGVWVTMPSIIPQALHTLGIRDAYAYAYSSDRQTLLEAFKSGTPEQQGQIWEDFVRSERSGLSTDRFGGVFDYIRDR